MYSYKYPMFAYTADVVIMAEDKTECLMIRRGKEPYKDMLAFPGGHVNQDESGINAAYREFEEECGINLTEYGIHLSFIKVLDGVKRDPRGRYISSAYGALVRDFDMFFELASAGDDAKSLVKFDVNNRFDTKFAFDHNYLLNIASITL